MPEMKGQVPRCRSEIHDAGFSRQLPPSLHDVEAEELHQLCGVHLLSAARILVVAKVRAGVGGVGVGIPGNRVHRKRGQQGLYETIILGR